jgi:predicted ferric reductase
MRLSLRTIVILGALLGLVIVAGSNEIAPARTEYLAQMRLWLVARATGMTAYLVLTVVVSLGLILSHPVNQSTWKLSKRIFPWHENLLVFILAFVVVHVVSLVLDPYAGVGLGGAIVPGLSEYRSVPVALGNLALYATLVVALTARYTKALPAGWWLKLHRLSVVIFGLAWAHGILAGTDAGAFRWVYVSTGLIVIGSAAYRYWVSKRKRPTFAARTVDAPTSEAQSSPAAGRSLDAGAIRALSREPAASPAAARPPIPEVHR